MRSPAATVAPGVTVIAERYDTEVRTPPPWSRVTERRPATDPANVTRPGEAAATEVPEGTAKSTPQCPP